MTDHSNEFHLYVNPLMETLCRYCKNPLKTAIEANVGYCQACLLYFGDDPVDQQLKER